MDDDLVLLTSYFNLANGRRQDNADTFRVDPNLPSQTSPDGTAALYIVTESSTGGQMGPRARRLAAETVAWEYSTHGHEQPGSRLRAALRTAHQEISREFDGHVSVGISVIAVEHDQVFLAQVAPAQVYVLHEGRLHSIAASVGGTSPFAHGLGASQGPEVSVFRDEIGPSDVLALCSSWFQRTPDAELMRESFGAGSADDIAEALYNLAKDHGVRDACCIVIEGIRASELETENEEAPQSLREQVDMAVQALAGVGRMLLSELRPADDAPTRNGAAPGTLEPEEEVYASPPQARPRGRRFSSGSASREGVTTEIPHVGTEATETERTYTWNPEATASWELSELATEERPAGRTVEQATEEIPAAPAEGAPPGPPENASTPRTEPGPTTRSRTSPAHREDLSPEEPIPEDPQPPRGESPLPDDAELEGTPRDRGRRGRDRAPVPVSELDELNMRLQGQQDMGDVIPPVQTFPDTSTTEPERIYATNRDIQPVNRRPRRFGGVARPPRDDSGAAPVIRPGDLGDVDLRQSIARPTPPALVWLGMAVIGIFLVVALVIFARNHFRNRTVASNPYPSLALAAMQRARTDPLPSQQNTDLSKAAQDIVLAKQNGASAARIQALQAELAQTRNVVFRISPVTAPIVAADFGKFPGSNPTEMANGPTTIFVLDSGRKAVYSLVPNSSPSQIVASGESDSGITVGTPVQLATSGSTALVLDDANSLIRDDNGLKTAIVLAKPSPAQKIVAMANIGTDVFLLDVAGSQIWRYTNAVSGTGSPPVGFFQAATNIGQAVAFTLDDRDIYILKSDGDVLKFDLTNASAQPFAIKTSLRQPLRNPTAIFTDQGLNYVWIADPANGRIVQVDKTGKYVRSYVSGTSALDLSRITGIVVPPGGKTLYVLSGKTVYHFQVIP